MFTLQTQCANDQQKLGLILFCVKLSKDQRQSIFFPFLNGFVYFVWNFVNGIHKIYSFYQCCGSISFWSGSGFPAFSCYPYTYLDPVHEADPDPQIWSGSDPDPQHWTERSGRKFLLFVSKLVSRFKTTTWTASVTPPWPASKGQTYRYQINKAFPLVR